MNVEMNRQIRRMEQERNDEYMKQEVHRDIVVGIEQRMKEQIDKIE